MATSKKSVANRNRKTLADGASQVTRDAAFNATRGVSGEDLDPQDVVTAIVPTAFTLTLDDHTPVSYEAGTQDMSREHAEHWFAQAMGVTIYGEEPPAAA